MNKIPTLYLRDWDNDPEYITRTPNLSALWVFANEGIATRKYDGTCVMFDGDCWWARREVKGHQTAPSNFVQTTEPDPNTNRVMGWIPMENSQYERFWREATSDGNALWWAPGTYELCGPRIGRNPEFLDDYMLYKHSEAQQLQLQLTNHNELSFDLLWHYVVYLKLAQNIEGIVWHHKTDPTKMAKIKALDFKHIRGLHDYLPTNSSQLQQ